MGWKARPVDLEGQLRSSLQGMGEECMILVPISSYPMCSARLVLGDLNPDGLTATADMIIASGGCVCIEPSIRSIVNARLRSDAVWHACDVRNWDEQLELFKLGIDTFGILDIVIPNAGVRELGQFTKVEEGQDGLPSKPNFDTLDINLTGVLYSESCCARGDELQGVM